ncbi:MAG: ribonuclease III [Clostridiales bacterium]|nr:ribonuclease III [Clostridiales bacterium]
MENTVVQRLTPVGLAFIGDAVHTLYVREYVTAATDSVVGTLHTAASRLVNAKCQAAVLDELMLGNALTAEEADVARRAKNAHLHSRAKTASPDAYHKATALEAVIGYVHVSGNVNRERELLEQCVQIGLRVTAKP